MELKILKEVCSTSGKNAKLKILKDNSSDKRLGDLLDATFNFKRKFFIKKIPLVFHLNNDPRDKHDEFMELLKALETGQYRGGSGESMVLNFLTGCTDLQHEWYRKILKKDLKCGFSVNTAIKAGFNHIPTFSVMLAKDGKLCKKLKEIVAKGVWVSPKLDGYRCLAVIDNGEVTLFSRNGTEYINFPTIVQSLKDCFPTGQHVFDGEIMSDDFQAMQKSAFANKRQTTVGDVGYHIFGYVDFDEWQAQKFSMATETRFRKLGKLGESFDNRLHLVQQVYTNDLTTIYIYQVQWEGEGYEGAMALPNIPYYVGKKTGRLLKFKEMLSQDCVVTGMYEGKSESRLEGTMGGVVVRQENGLRCECGSGWTDEDRRVMWDNQELYIGSIIEVKYQELTKDGIMRFPVFSRWRNDKT